MIRSFLLACFKGVIWWEATILRGRFTGPVIAITGSIGKTSTREAIGLVARQLWGDRILITAKNLNTEIGVPLTLLGYHDIPQSAIGWLLVPLRGLLVALFQPSPRGMVLELGADRPGDIAALGRLVRPTVAVITAVTEAHSAALGSREAIGREKSSLLPFLPLNGIAILNGDDPGLAKVALAPNQRRILVRLQGRGDYFATGIRVDLAGTEAIIHHHNRTKRVRISSCGAHHILSVLFAAAVGDLLGVSPTEQGRAFKSLAPPPGRGALIEGKRGSLILDESYNASPTAVAQSLKVLGDLPARRRVAILGDMRELRESEEAHRIVGRQAREIVDYLIGVGPLARHYHPDEWFATSDEATPGALRQLGPGVIILVKGSQDTIRLERLVKELMRHPEAAGHLLVRQGPAWEKKP